MNTTAKGAKKCNTFTVFRLEDKVRKINETIIFT